MSKISYKQFIPKFDIKLSNPFHYSLREILQYDIIDFDIELSNGKKLQRDYCWDLKQKQELIISIFKGIQIPEFHVGIYKEDREGFDRFRKIAVVDGKQRLSTIIDFYNNKFCIELDGCEYNFNDLDDISQHKIYTSSFMAFRTRYEYWDDLISDEEYINWFEFVNFTVVPQDKEHLENLRK